MRNELKILLGAIAVIALTGIAYAANDEDTDTQVAQEKNMTYGRCVSEHAKIKNTCYATMKSALENCKAQAEQNSAKKDAAKQCKQTYKKEKKQCKATFKESKRNICAKIKHNFLETMGSAFK